MLKIRLQKTGKKNAPSFRLVLTEKTSAPQKKAIEILGHYNPRSKEKAFNKERVLYWISQGAQPSDTAFNLLHDENIVEGKKIENKKISKRKREEAKKKNLEEVETKKKEAEEKASSEATAKEEAEKEKEKKEEVSEKEIKEEVKENTKEEAK